MTDPGRIFELASRTTTFTVTEQHLALLRHAHVDWEYMEFGAPAIDGKRPYGNSDVLGDIIEILGEDAILGQGVQLYDGDPEDRELLPHVEERLNRLHAETGIALQIALVTGKFEAGDYRKAETWSTRWEKV